MALFDLETTTTPSGTKVEIDTTGAESVKIRLGAINVDGGLISTGNPLPVAGAVTVLPKTPFTFRTQISATQTNLALSTPGAAFRITSISIASKIGSAVAPDNPSILIGIAAATTPTGSQVIFAHPSFPIGTSDRIMLDDLADGGASDKVLITTGTIVTDVLEVYGTGYLK